MTISRSIRFLQNHHIRIMGFIICEPLNEPRIKASSQVSLWHAVADYCVLRCQPLETKVEGYDSIPLRTILKD